MIRLSGVSIVDISTVDFFVTDVRNLEFRTIKHNFRISKLDYAKKHERIIKEIIDKVISEFEKKKNDKELLKRYEEEIRHEFSQKKHNKDSKSIKFSDFARCEYLLMLKHIEFKERQKTHIWENGTYKSLNNNLRVKGLVYDKLLKDIIRDVVKQYNNVEVIFSRELKYKTESSEYYVVHELDMLLIIDYEVYAIEIKNSEIDIMKKNFIHHPSGAQTMNPGSFMVRELLFDSLFYDNVFIFDLSAKDVYKVQFTDKEKRYFELLLKWLISKYSTIDTGNTEQIEETLEKDVFKNFSFCRLCDRRSRCKYTKISANLNRMLYTYDEHKQYVVKK